MSTKNFVTIEDLYKVEGQAELVNGKIVRMPLHGCYIGTAIDNLKANLYEYSKHGKKGYPLGSTVAYIVDLPHRKAFCPDLAFCTEGDFSMEFPVGAPIFAAEFRDPDNYGPAAERKILDKIRDYFDAGTQVIWDADVLQKGVVRVYRATDPDRPTIYRKGEIAEAEPALPGWSIPVDSLFSLRRRNIQE